MNLPGKGISAEHNGAQDLPSIFDSVPMDLGGIHARQGFAYQDDVAAGLYLKLLSTNNLIEVSCETYDDILLVWQDERGRILEFVQVKAEHLDQLWTIAQLCKQSKSSKKLQRIGTSFLEKSLDRDQYSEPSWFRVVTCRQINSDLAVLTRERDHVHRSVSYPQFKYLRDEVEKYLHGIKSMKGNDFLYWLTNTQWYVIDENDIESLNIRTLTEVLYGLGHPYDPDTVREIYNNLRTLAKETAAFGIENWEKKRVSRDQLLSKISAWISPYPDKGKVERLEQKLSDAGLDRVCLNVAKDQQWFYLQKKRSASYFTTEHVEEVEQQVLDKLATLRSSLDSGKVMANGVQFHDLCLSEVRSLQRSFKSTNDDLIPNYLVGCMYEITARCRHRFTRFHS